MIFSDKLPRFCLKSRAFEQNMYFIYNDYLIGPGPSDAIISKFFCIVNQIDVPVGFRIGLLTIQNRINSLPVICKNLVEKKKLKKKSHTFAVYKIEKSRPGDKGGLRYYTDLGSKYWLSIVSASAILATCLTYWMNQYGTPNPS